MPKCFAVALVVLLSIWYAPVHSVRSTQTIREALNEPTATPAPAWEDAVLLTRPCAMRSGCADFLIAPRDPRVP